MPRRRCLPGRRLLEGAVFSEDFLQFQATPAQCNSWDDFLDNRLGDTSFNRITIAGTFDPTGVTCNDPSAATQICQALHHRTSDRAR